jgi:hypothetical protein
MYVQDQAQSEWANSIFYFCEDQGEDVCQDDAC